MNTLSKITILILLSLNSFSQQLTDTIITINNDTIICKVTFVNEYSIFYKFKKKKKLKDKIIPRIDVSNLLVSNKDINIPSQKNDSGINGYFRKSKLNRKYECLLLKENTDKSLKLLADSTFKINDPDYLYIATAIQSFANNYKCKLIYLSDLKKINPNKVNVKLYDASDEYYHKVLEKTKENKIFFLRTNNKNQYKEINIKIKNEKITMYKNEYKMFYLSKIDSSSTLKPVKIKNNNAYDKDSLFYNEYYYIGNQNYYSAFNPKSIVFFGAAVLGGIIAGGGGFMVVIISSKKTRINNFIGEFIRNSIDRNNNESPTNAKNNGY